MFIILGTFSAKVYGSVISARITVEQLSCWLRHGVWVCVWVRVCVCMCMRVYEGEGGPMVGFYHSYMGITKQYVNECCHTTLV